MEWLFTWFVIMRIDSYPVLQLWNLMVLKLDHNLFVLFYACFGNLYQDLSI